MSSLGAPGHDFMERRTQESSMRKTAFLGTAALVALSAAATTLAVMLPTNVQASLPTPFNLRNDPGVASVKLADGRVLDLFGSEDGLVLSDRQTFHLSSPRRFASLTVMPTGQVLIWGGIDNEGRLIETGEWFEPSTGALVTTGRLGLPVRAGHTLNVLSDGTLAMTGGWGQGNVPADDVALWRPLDRHLDVVAGDTGHARLNARASLLADGTLQIHGGVDEVGRPVHDDWRFGAADGQKVRAHGIAASYPARDKNAASPIGPLALRFADPVDVNQLNGTVSLLGPNGVVKTHVVGAEGGRLAFVQLPDELYPAARYTIFVQGLHTAAGDAVPYEAIGFTTRAARSGVVVAGEGKRPGVPTSEASGEPPIYVMAGTGKVTPCKPVDAFHLCRSKGEVKDGAFYPGQDNVATASGGHWRLYKDRQTLPDTRERESNLPKGATALIGQVRRIDESPVANVEITVAGQHVRTDTQGVFVLRDLPPGRNELFVDGGPAGNASTEYGRFIVGADVAASTVNHMPYVMYLPRVLARDKVALPSPTTHETVLTHPDMPGLELRIPAGAVFKDRNGKVLTEIAIVPTPVDHAPFPLPDNFPTYFTIQPGDAVVQGMTPDAAKGIQVVYPNYGKQKPADKADFWVYSAEKGWDMYGAGHISSDASQLVSDKDTRLVWALGAGASTNPPEPDNGKKPDNKCSGEPVDLQTGMFFHRWEDVRLDDTMPVIVDRTSSGLANPSSPFGLGTGTLLAMTISSSSLERPKVVLPCGEAINFDLVSGAAAWPLVGTVWRHTGTKSAMYGATLEFLNDSTPEGAHWVMTLIDGSQFWFDRHAPNKLARHMDRYGNTVLYSYNGGLLTQVISPNGRSVNFTYNGQNLISGETDSIGRTVNYEYVHRSAPAEGYALTKVTYPDATWEAYTYDALTWNIKSIRDRDGATSVSNEFDDLTHSRVVKQTFADGSTMQFDYEIENGKVNATTVTDANGHKERTEFDSVSLYPVRVTRAYGTTLAQTSLFARDPSGLLRSITDSIGRVTKFSFDSRGNMTSVSRMSGTSEETTISLDYLVDDNQVTSITDALGNKTRLDYLRGCLSAVTNPEGEVTEFTCNSSGQLASVTDALGHTRRFKYRSGDLISETDPIGRETRFTTDPIGRRVSATRPDGVAITTTYDTNNNVISSVDLLGRATDLSYDGNGNLITVTLPNGSTTHYEYDGMNRRLARVDELGAREAWTYDAAGLLATYADRKGQKSTFDHDALDRVTLATYSDGTGVSYSYDAANRLIEALDSASGSIQWTYDDFDRRISEAGPGSSVSFGYDRAGRRATTQVEGMPSLSYSYDKANRVTSMTQGTDKVTFSYDLAGHRSKMVLPNGVQAAYGFDDASELTSLSYVTASNAPLLAITYQYDLAGQRVSQGGDGVPDLPSATATDTVFDKADRVLNASGLAYTYDANGSMTSDGTHQFVWDARNRLTSVQVAGSAVLEYRYDALGRRVSKVADGVASGSYVYDGPNVALETGDTGVAYFNGPGIDEHIGASKSGQKNFYITDGLRSVLALSDPTGNITDRYSYTPYGQSRHIGSSANAYTYTGREDDGEGLYFYRNRYYSAKLGRFISEDPAGFAGGSLNLHAYARGNPAQRSDPLGLDDTVCGYNPSMCGMQNNAPANTDVFGFGSTEREVPLGPAHGGAEAVGLLGYNPSDGFYSGAIGGVMGGVGGASNNAKYIYGTEILSSDPHFKPISMVEVNLGPEIPDVGGLEFGGGFFKSCDEVGFYIHAGGSFIGEHGAIGFGFGQRF